MTLGGDNHAHEPCRSVYSVYHSTQTTGSIDDADAPQHKRDSYWRKIVYSRSQPDCQRQVRRARVPQSLRQRLVVKFGGGSTMANGNVSPLGARQLYALEQQNLGREPGAPQLLQFIVRVPSFAIFDHRYLDVYFVPGFYKVLNKEVNPKGLEMADYGLYWMLYVHIVVDVEVG
ncbi:hypothetical protein EDB89DRAFT_1902467 [Lactarius sanguifluus]|nr:hypothetical protein EDB89DRAFT_1902467 [Lactarius sanguifluus]